MEKTNHNRPLKIDFEFYTDGDDAFKVELVTLLISNLRELQQSLHSAREKNDNIIFQTASHKVKPSLSMLNDEEFTTLVDDMKETMFDQDKYQSFNRVSENIITSLEKELN
jgi:aminopeptidase-like protein